MISVDQALRLIEGHARALDSCDVALADALGLVLAADAVSDVDSPPHDKAMMDGYAVVSGDPAPVRDVIEEVVAGAVPTRRLTPGHATRIMTGAPLPEGADAVVPVEQSETVGEGAVRLPTPGPPAGKHVMRRGAAIESGQVVMPRGRVIGAHAMGLLAETGHARVNAIPAPRVGVLATGDELVACDQRPGPGQIRNSNGPMLLALLREAGAWPVDLGVARDDEASLVERLRAGRSSDVLLVSGGVSAGRRDLAPGVLEELGAACVFHKVAVRPGKPLWFGVWPGAADGGASDGQTLVFGLPGNPVSSYVCCQVFVRPLLAALAGRGFQGLPRVTAELEHDLTHAGGREAFVPAHLKHSGDAAWRVATAAWRGSADLAGLASADALLHLPTEAAQLRRGAAMEVLVIGPQTAASPAKQLT